MSPIDDELVVPVPQLVLRRVPVAPRHLDEVPEPFGARHRRAREIAELAAVGDALEDHLARLPPAGRACRGSGRGSTARRPPRRDGPERARGSPRPDAAPPRRESARTRVMRARRSGRPAGSADPAHGGRTRRRARPRDAGHRACRAPSEPSTRPAMPGRRRNRRRSPRRCSAAASPSASSSS